MLTVHLMLWLGVHSQPLLVQSWFLRYSSCVKECWLSAGASVRRDAKSIQKSRAARQLCFLENFENRHQIPSSMVANWK